MKYLFFCLSQASLVVVSFLSRSPDDGQSLLQSFRHYYQTDIRFVQDSALVYRLEHWFLPIGAEILALEWFFLICCSELHNFYRFLFLPTCLIQYEMISYLTAQTMKQNDFHFYSSLKLQEKEFILVCFVQVQKFLFAEGWCLIPLFDF